MRFLVVLAIVSAIVSGSGCTKTGKCVEEPLAKSPAAYSGEGQGIVRSEFGLVMKFGNDSPLNPGRRALFQPADCRVRLHTFVAPRLERSAGANSELSEEQSVAVRRMNEIRARLKEWEGAKGMLFADFRKGVLHESLLQLGGAAPTLPIQLTEKIANSMGGNAVHFGFIGTDPAAAAEFVTLNGSPRIRNKLVVKYQTDCPDYPSAFEHPLVRELVFQEFAAQLGIAPVALYLSHSMQLPEWSETKLAGFCDHPIYNQFPNVRFLVMERVGANLSKVWHAIADEMDLGFLIRLLARSMELLRTLHMAGLVHGDIHVGNIAFRDSEAEWDRRNPDLVLIDFGKARFYPFDDDELLAAKAQPSDRIHHLSPWEIAGHRKAPRDDVYRLVEVFAKILQGETLEPKYSRFCDKAEMLRWKSDSGNLFSISRDEYGVDPLSGLAEAPGIYDLLEELTREIRSLTSPAALPDYATIGAILDRISQIVDVGRVRAHAPAD